MKKLLALMLAAALALSLVACGGGSGAGSGNTPSTGNGDTTSIDTPGGGGEESENPSDTTTNEDIQLPVGETYSLGAFDITITGFDFTEEAVDPDPDGTGFRPKDGYVSANLYYTIKFTGKAEVGFVRCAPSTLFYGDGYVFNNVDKFWYYDESYGWTDNSSSSIQPLTPEFPCKACFFVPKEVETEKGNALSIMFMNFDSDNTQIYFSPRPEDENLKEQICNYCIEMEKANTWDERKFARNMLIELNDYKNCGIEARMHFFTYDDRKYFKEYVQNMEPMNADDIQAVLSGTTFSMRNNYRSDGVGPHTITFLADGTVDATYTLHSEERVMYVSWRMENGSVVCTQSGKSGPVNRYFTPYQFDETRYLLIDTEDDYSMVLTQQ